MDNENKNNSFDPLMDQPMPEAESPAPDFSVAESWLDTDSNPPEIGADESAVAGHSMADLSDIELERIIQEAMSAEWDDLTQADAPASADPEAFQDNAYSDNGSYPEEDELPEEELPEGMPPRKVRPRKKGGYGLFGLPHLASTAIWLGLALLIGISLGRLVWLCAADVLAFGRQDRDVTITITEADTLDTITQKLHDNGLINYPELFKLYAKLAKVEEKGKISVGTFDLNTLFDYHALVGGMSSTSSFRQTVKVAIPEGYTCAQIFALLEERGVCTAKALEDYATQSEFSSYWFLEDVPKGHKYCLEGFLFPDTYEFYSNDTPQRIFSKMLARFDDKFDDEMRAQLEELNVRLANMYKRNGISEDRQIKFTVREVVIVASLIEKETAHSGEIRNISSVIYNRLTNPNTYPTLDLDATLVYALGRNDLTGEDKFIDHPYNTYQNNGLPPGAISNPGIFSLRGALTPAETDYYFYALDPTAEIREHRFFRNYDEHKAFLDSLGY